MKTLPDNVAPYKRTPVFTQDTVPRGLLKDHNTKEGVWALIQVQEGRLRYIIDGQGEYILTPGVHGVVEPQVPHHIAPEGDVVFFVEFYRS